MSVLVRSCFPSSSSSSNWFPSSALRSSPLSWPGSGEVRLGWAGLGWIELDRERMGGVGWDGTDVYSLWNGLCLCNRAQGRVYCDHLYAIRGEDVL